MEVVPPARTRVSSPPASKASNSMQCHQHHRSTQSVRTEDERDCPGFMLSFDTFVQIVPAGAYPSRCVPVCAIPMTKGRPKNVLEQKRMFKHKFSIPREVKRKETRNRTTPYRLFLVVVVVLLLCCCTCCASLS